MALTSAIRRASSRVIPFELRASAGSQRYFHHHHHHHHHHHWGSALLLAVRQPPRNTLRKSLFPSFLNHYSSKPRSNSSLLRIIHSKLKYAKASLEGLKAEEVPERFPFEIEDHPGHQYITLHREYRGETITIEVKMPRIVTGEDSDNDNEDFSDNNNDDEEKDRGDQHVIPMVVTVSKNKGPSLEFRVTAYLDHLEIDSLSINDPESYEAIYLDRYLDEDLQKSFRKYLKIRGIRDSTMDFLYGFMFDKDCRDYIAGLKKLQKIFQA